LLAIAKERLLSYLYWIVVVALAVVATPEFYDYVKAADNEVVPYTVALQEYQLLPNGTANPTSMVTYATRSDGSRAIEASSLNTQEGRSVAERILTFSSGKTSYIFENKRQKSTTLDPSRNSKASLPNLGNHCQSPGMQPQQKVAGFEQVGQYRASKVIIGPLTLWFALDYGCALVKERDEWSDGQVSEKKLVSLLAGEPSATLFDDPSGFQEVPPSTLFPGAMSRELDSYYYSHRP
jgi:hypothetical protein